MYFAYWELRSCLCFQLQEPWCFSGASALVLSFSRVVVRQIKLHLEFLYTLVHLHWILGCLATEFSTCFPMVWPRYNCVQYKSHPMAQEVTVLRRESPSFYSINVEANFHPGAESHCL